VSEDPDELARIEADAYAEATGMTDPELWVTLTEDTQGMVDAMRQVADNDTWRGVPPEKLHGIAQFIEDALPVHDHDSAYELARRLRHVGLLPRGRR
jgi:hypothetical protein